MPMACSSDITTSTCSAGVGGSTTFGTLHTVLIFPIANKLTTDNNMCRQVQCPNCQKPTWTGCGMHVANALGAVPVGLRCPNWRKGVSHPCSAAGGEAHAAWTHPTTK
eukprot:Nitzschia sp. Nitz4//scaffold60_size111251//14640//15070//NITZ4_004137-RA/size111251-snap-gene-0.190-mRNA-1//-1//CDS//3329555534//3639//frame0